MKACKLNLMVAVIAAAAALTSHAQLEEVLQDAPQADDSETSALADESAVDLARTLYLRAGGGDDALAASCELNSPISDSQFDWNLRLFYLRVESTERRSYTSTYYTYGRYRAYRHTYTYYYTDDVEQYNVGGEATGLWRPFRGKPFSPFVGAGLRYERFDSDNDSGGDASVALRLGFLIDLKRFFITGEYIYGEDSNELIGDFSFRLTSRTELHVFVEKIEIDLDDSVAFGAGMSFAL